MSDELELRSDVVDALVVLVGIALFQNQDHEAATLLDALRPWRGASVELRFYDAWMAMRRDDFAQAARLLQALHDNGAGRKAALCQVLLATTLFVLHDPGWQGHAEAVLEHGDHALARRFAGQLLGRSAAPVTGTVTESDSAVHPADGSAATPHPASAAPAPAFTPRAAPPRYLRA